MDWKQILSLSNENLTDERKEDIYNELIKDQKFDSKIAKKLFPLCLTVLRYKGQQVEKQREEIEMLASSDIDLKSTLEQLEKQKKMINKYEADRVQFKARIKELSDEITIIHGRNKS
ncbi:centrosomal protein Cep290-like [Chironomus tepperi]|uniref:centrosomal protein Cep290-like n=1 Tax=Chironomus tepperi TaxID=113505 RepID=UPI00391F55A2